MHAPFVALFRFGTKWDIFCTLLSVICGMVHGSTMPMAFFFISDLYAAVYMPNDDGSLPPVDAPHSIRNHKVAEVGMTYVLLALVVLIARTGGCYLAIHAADRQVVAARRQYFYQVLMQGPAWHDMHQANEPETQFRGPSESSDAAPKGATRRRGWPRSWCKTRTSSATASASASWTSPEPSPWPFRPRRLEVFA